MKSVKLEGKSAELFAAFLKNIVAEHDLEGSGNVLICLNGLEGQAFSAVIGIGDLAALVADGAGQSAEHVYQQITTNPDKKWVQ